MESLDNDIIEAGIDAEKEAYNLVLQAICASTTHEKDKIIDKIQDYWKVHEQASFLLNGCLQSLNNQLSNMKLKLKNIQEEYQTKIMNTAFIGELQKKKERKSAADYISNIRDIENQISKSGPLPNPKLLDKISSLPEEQDPFHLKLRDLLFKRLEQLTYGLKKRTFTVDESEDVSVSISEEFGNLTGLISRYNQLLEENQKLKHEEILLLNDKIVKRRDLVSISPTLLANLGLALQSELEMEHAVGNSQIIPPNFLGNFRSFDELQPHAGDITFSPPEFSTTISPETVDDLVKADKPGNQLQALKKVMKEQQDTINKLTNDLIPLREKKYSKNDKSQTREDRLLSMHDKFSSQISELTKKIDAENDIVQHQISKLLDIILERRALGIQYGQWLHKYKELINDHSNIIQLQKNNVSIIDSLSSISYNFGLNMLSSLRNDKRENSEDFNKLLLNKSQPYIEIAEARAIELKKELQKMETKNSEEDNLQVPTLALMKQFQPNPRTKRKRLTISPEFHDPEPLCEIERSDHSEHEFSLVSSFDNLERKEKKSKKEKSIENSPKPPKNEPKNVLKNPILHGNASQLLNYIALTYDIKTMKTHFHKTISGHLHFQLSDLERELKKGFDSYNDYLLGEIKLTQKASHLVLCKEKMGISTDADTQPRTDGEGQTIEEELNPPKGKDKKPAKGKKGK